MTDNPINRNQSNQAERADLTRGRILDAATREFSLHGLAGARTERIAEAAGVNKALLYYYFESKEKLYAAALEMIANRVRDTTMAVFFGSATPGERVLRMALNHFDRILAQQEFQSLMQQEMVRLHKGETAILPIIVKKVFEPMLILYRSILREGIASGELIDADWMQIHLSTLGANVLYFLSAPVMQMVTKEDPLTLEALAERRKAIVEFLGQAIFRDRQHGTELAAKVYADTPMPAVEPGRSMFGRNL